MAPEGVPGPMFPRLGTREAIIRNCRNISAPGVHRTTEQPAFQSSSPL
jgi:hypothetical protein